MVQNLLKNESKRPMLAYLEMGGISMIGNICTGVCAGMMIIMAVTPVVILFVERAIF